MLPLELAQLELTFLSHGREHDYRRFCDILATILQILNEHAWTYQFYKEGIQYADSAKILPTIIVVVFRGDQNISTLLHIIPPRLGPLREYSDADPLSIVIHAFQVEDDSSSAVLKAVRRIESEVGVEYASWLQKDNMGPVAPESDELNELFSSIKSSLHFRRHNLN